MANCRNDFETEKYSCVYEIDIPDRQARFVVDTLNRIAAEHGIDMLIARVDEDRKDGRHAKIGIALTNDADYAVLIKGLDEAIFARQLEHIQTVHGPGHPMARYLQQLEWQGAADDQFRAFVEGHIRESQDAALQAAYDDWNAVRAQWADAPQPGLPGP